uniref:Ig-like domain-containing protein n=1 Tax=Xiphophorus maculatus TaxID=8083 RepID=A0A3B5QKB9_XIPMA
GQLVVLLPCSKKAFLQEDKTFTPTLKPTNQTAAAGQCVVLECSFENNVTSFTWCKNGQSGECNLQIFNSSNNSTVDSKILGRVTMLEPDLKKKNCSILITNLTTTDTGVYKVKAEADIVTSHQLPFISILQTVQERNVTLEIAPLKNKRYITLTCSVPGSCSGFKPQFTWTYQKAAKTDNPTIISHTSSLTFKASSEHHNMNVTCRVGFPGNTSKEKTLNTSCDITNGTGTPTISGKSTIKQDESLNLTCTVDSFPLSVITWSKRGLNKTLNNETKYGTSTLVIHNVTEQHSGQYFCYANHLNKTLEQDINITVISKYSAKSFNISVILHEFISVTTHE